MTPQDAASIRARLWDGGFRPVAVYNHDSRKTESPGKAPKGEEWTARNRANPPADAIAAPDPDALNTGILCDGLRAIDVDVDNLTMAASIRSMAMERFGEAPLRYRDGSGRCLVLYRAANGAPPKRWIKGTFGKVEVLGLGQQFVAFGIHPTGAELRWMPEGPGDVSVDHLPAITEDQITAFLDEAAPVIAAEPEARRANGHTSPQTSKMGLRGDALQVVAALCAIPNAGAADWEGWNRIGMAAWAASGGNIAGLAAFHAWSSQHPTYDADETDRRWAHYAISPPTSIGAGTLFHLARGSREEPTPANDEHDGGETPAQTTQTAQDPDKPPSKYPLPVKFFNEISASIDCADFIEGLLIIAAMSVVYGQSNSGKTFWTLDLALHVAAGMMWNGREVDRCGILWLAMEGAHGISNRITAWREHHNIGESELPFAVIPVALNLLDHNADTGPLIETIHAIKKRLNMAVGWVIVDTLSRAIAGGNENGPDDMGALVTNGSRIQQETQAHVTWIHHSGKDEAKGARGHSLLRAATDTEIEISADGQHIARVTKQRELENTGEFPFTLKVVELGTNRRGKPVTSCVVEVPDDAIQTQARTVRLKGHPQRAVNALTDVLAEKGKSGFPGTPAGCPSVPEEWWRERFYDRSVSDGGTTTQDSKRKAFVRAAQELLDRRIIAINKGRVWLVSTQFDPDKTPDMNPDIDA